MKNLIPLESVEQKILLVRGHRVLLDRDLARLYEVETRALNQAVKRNLERSPDDFVMSYSGGDHEDITICDILRSQVF